MISTRIKTRCVTVVFGLLATCVLARGREGSLFDTHGYGARAISLSNAMAAQRGDFTGIYYNPAAMIGQSSVQVALGFDAVIPKLMLTFDELPTADEANAILPSNNIGIISGQFSLGEFEPPARIALACLHHPAADPC